jgi:uncharacterized membrane protein
MGSARASGDRRLGQGVSSPGYMSDAEGERRLLQAQAGTGTADARDRPASSRHPLRHRQPVRHLEPTFGSDAFGRQAEKFARFFGTPKFIIGQTVLVLAWITLNALAIVHHWDPYPFILLNLCFSTQAAYAAPLILLAQTRQADRDKASAEADANHREELALSQERLLTANTALTGEVFDLTRRIGSETRLLQEIHRHVTALSPLAGEFGPEGK